MCFLKAENERINPKQTIVFAYKVVLFRDGRYYPIHNYTGIAYSYVSRAHPHYGVFRNGSLSKNTLGFMAFLEREIAVKYIKIYQSCSTNYRLLLVMGEEKIVFGADNTSSVTVGSPAVSFMKMTILREIQL